jgi:D-arabinose 1-dehydrogenase-like Zn-dependent alcohol dehydrogenase
MLLMGERSIRGFAGGDLKETMSFSMQFKVMPIVEVFQLEQASMAFEKIMVTKVQFRAVLKMPL